MQRQTSHHLLYQRKVCCIYFIDFVLLPLSLLRISSVKSTLYTNLQSIFRPFVPRAVKETKDKKENKNSKGCKRRYRVLYSAFSRELFFFRYYFGQNIKLAKRQKFLIRFNIRMTNARGFCFYTLSNLFFKLAIFGLAKVHHFT